MGFKPEEILFMPTAGCNLACPHCNVKRSRDVLSTEMAKKFILDCKRHAIKRIGFTGGEPFLAPDFLFSVTGFAAKNGLFFNTIMTNAVWFKNRTRLNKVLKKLFNAGYDGSISVSVDAYHKQDLKKVTLFIKAACSIWRRPDMVSIAYVTGADRVTKKKLQRLAGLLKARLSGFGGTHPVIKSTGNNNSRAGLNLPYHIKIVKIELSPIGKALKLKDPWDGRWFKEDYCKGPGNVFLIEPSGDVKPCCGYANELKEFTIGNIKTDDVAGLMKNIRQNEIICDIFDLGLSGIRGRLKSRGIKFPGKTSNNCFFCRYIMTKVPRKAFLKMKNLFMFFILIMSVLCAGLVCAETTEDYGEYSTPGPGMEERKVNNDVTVLMPKGSKMSKRNETTQIMEGVDEYAAGKFVDVNKRLDKLEKEAAEMKEEISSLKSKLSDIGKSPNEDLPGDAER